MQGQWLFLGLALADWASAATIVAAIVAVPSVLVAVVSYRGTSRAARLAHMHKLFGDYLRLKFDHESRVGPSNIAQGEMVSFKLYSLEEMTLWLEKERRTLDHLFNRRGYRAALRAWDETIAFHIGKEPQATYNSMKEFPTAFTDKFRLLVLEQCHAKAVRLDDADYALIGRTVPPPLPAP